MLRLRIAAIRSTATIAERWMSVLRRSVDQPRGGTWEMTAIGEFHDGKTARAMYGPAEQVVRGLAGS